MAVAGMARDFVSNSAPGGNDGEAYGHDIFMMTGSSLTVNSSNDITIGSPIEGNQSDQTGIATPVDYTSTSNPLGGLTKQGTGDLTLTGENSYSGTTTLTAGTLHLAPNDDQNASLSSDVTVSGGELELEGNCTIKSIAATTNFPNVPGDLSISGGEVTFLMPSSTDSDAVDSSLNVAGDFSHTGGTLNLYIDNSTDRNSNDITIGRMLSVTNGMLEVTLPTNFSISDINFSRALNLNFKDSEDNALSPAYSEANITVMGIPSLATGTSFAGAFVSGDKLILRFNNIPLNLSAGTVTELQNRLQEGNIITY